MGAPRGNETTSPGIEESATLPDPRPSPATLDTMPSAQPRGAFTAGSTIGRFVVIDRLGEGGMGIVLAARDPTLDRTVAVKVLRGGGNADGNRLLREAQALARLSHENVVPIYEAGEVDGEVYVAMELVRGTTLTAWLAASSHDWREIVRVFVQAGRGLAAAHAAGLVHRDFKPDNVLVSSTGRVLVTDFGLAVARGAAAREMVDTGTLLGQRMTRTGAIAGTPVYMAPEQFGDTVDARTDQFAFCVSLYEALFRRVPFDGSNIIEYLAHANAHEIRPAVGRRVPARLWNAIVRGLSPQRDQRFADLDALVDVLERVRRRAVTPPRIATGAALLAIVGTAGWWLANRPAPDTCAAAAAPLAAVWNDPASRAIHDAFTRTGASWGATTADTVARALDARAAAWTTQRIDVCRSPGDHAELRTACLDAALDDTRRVLAMFAAPDKGIVRSALRVVATLSSPARCGDVSRLAAIGLPAQPTDRVVAAEVRALISQASLLVAIGRRAASLETADAAVARAKVLDEPALRAEAVHARARALGELEPGSKRLYETILDEIDLATHAHDDEILTDAWTEMLELCANHEWPSCGGGLPARMAHAALASLGGDTEREAQLLDAESAIALTRDDFAGAKKLRERALTLAAADGYNAAIIESNLARGMVDGDEDPTPHANHALAILRELGGTDHPDQNVALEALGIFAAQHERFADAEAMFRRELAVQLGAYGEHHLAIAGIHHNLGTLAEQQHQFDRALTEHQVALAIEEAIDPGGKATADSWVRIGVIEEELGRRPASIDAFARAVALREKVVGHDDPIVAGTLVMLSHRQVRAARWDDALASLRRALAIYEPAEGPTGAEVAETLEFLAFAEGRGGAPTVDPLERAVRIRGTIGDPKLLAVARGELAQASWARNRTGDRARALDLAAQAGTGFASGSPERADLDEWLAHIGHAAPAAGR